MRINDKRYSANLDSCKIHAACAVARRYGMIDCAHHKQWVIDQMLRALLGPDAYAAWVREMNADPDYLPWDTGIAP